MKIKPRKRNEEIVIIIKKIFYQRNFRPTIGEEKIEVRRNHKIDEMWREIEKKIRPQHDSASIIVIIETHMKMKRKEMA